MDRNRNFIATIVPVLCSLSLFGTEAAAQSYASAVRAFLSESGQINLHNYQFLPLPTARFGIGTMYPPESIKNDFDLLRMGIYGDPNSWWVNLSDNDRLTALRAIVRVEEIGAIGLNGKQTKALTLAAVFPQMLTAAQSSLDPSRISVLITASGAYTRVIDWLELDDAVNLEHLFRSSIVEHATKRDFVMTTEDLVLDGFAARITATGGGVDANAALDSALASFVRQSKSPFSLERRPDGSYNLKSMEPIVAAIYVTLPPKMPWAEVGDRRLPALNTPGLLRQIAKAEAEGAAIISH